MALEIGRLICLSFDAASKMKKQSPLRLKQWIALATFESKKKYIAQVSQYPP